MDPLVPPVAALSPAEAERTSRHATLYPLGELGQRRLAGARVTIVGAGGLGSPAVLALAAAGVGHLTVIDDDTVDASNLQRQVLHRVADVGAPKVASAVRAAAELAPECDVVAVQERITPANAERLLSGSDVVLDGTDSFASRAAVAAAAERLGVPLVWGVVQEFHAQVTVFWPGAPAGVPATRLSDLHPVDAVGNVPSCAEVGVLGPLVMQIGSMMATQAVLLITGVGDPLLGRVVLVDALRSTVREVPLHAAAATGERTQSLPRADTIDPATTYVDVRDADEWATGVIPGAVLLSLPDLAAATDAQWEGTVVTVCQSGVRSDRAARILRDRGARATSLPGGMDAWDGAVVLPEGTR
ncbi:ThiF family adenylyltransferase [Microbacterium amylolyticum]|uniref:Adenylyltransferase/sulfurtransferase n=1 Tax=Microbacterium amylolyticum TaxID=936337 RepID=A0ABS4ZFG7_9MICO|nr:ThiF family adenylyltransferase [Microbacterium amylolyticum]MBP2435783.1 adenylyltransferase/sulfurtransferase [Microbacterium amylolyticum]